MISSYSRFIFSKIHQFQEVRCRLYLTLFDLAPTSALRVINLSHNRMTLYVYGSQWSEGRLINFLTNLRDCWRIPTSGRSPRSIYVQRRTLSHGIKDKIRGG